MLVVLLISEPCRRCIVPCVLKQYGPIHPEFYRLFRSNGFKHQLGKVDLGVKLTQNAIYDFNTKQKRLFPLRFRVVSYDFRCHSFWLVPFNPCPNRFYHQCGQILFLHQKKQEMDDHHRAKEWPKYCPSIKTHPHNQFMGKFYILLQGNKKPRSIIAINSCRVCVQQTFRNLCTFAHQRLTITVADFSC